ncbi:murein hydrolase activator EnvC family protein [Campylobacter geochelonis]|uniref:M24/M37 family peptidase n=1 Tax=Campylobacter geochelonis TaxID=1780362 RepID=A0A128ELB2_9BACT|nr:peptidoglycan DD-metalloendopeptidase family protein [Campylobacter geochelonis]QKF71698.1 zinc metallopeptidase, M23 family [Campylobacter geochelonis]CZE49222.1 M24/M37 family peptidase [Campylobacter geochelonis]CZE51315.1 M24/M37 family peptidase [Campylobacter geochelonis]
MIRVFLAILFFFSLNLCASSQSTKDKIKNTTESMQTKQSEEKQLSQKVEELANLIVQKKKEVKEAGKKIDELSGYVLNLSQKYQEEELELTKLNSQNALLLSSQKELEDKIISLIADDFSFDLVQNDDVKTTQNLISNEIFDTLSVVLKDELENLLTSYDKTSKSITEQSKKITTIQQNLKEYNDKKAELAKEKEKHEVAALNLNKNREQYILRLQKLQKENDELRDTLEKLKIIDDKEERAKAKAAEEKRLAKLEASKKKQVSQKDKQILSSDEEDIEIADEVRDVRVDDIDKKVKQYGSSYQASRVKKYSGAKTISPLKDAFVKRKFGNYTDPVYNIKIFNESIVLGSKSKDTQVYNILPGKVIFAKETAVLDKVIIMENGSGIHTIYAHLSQIAPTIKVGSYIKKGYAIGRIRDDLTFEVTQKNYHINPLELISLK